jgi:hypothetical protein
MERKSDETGIRDPGKEWDWDAFAVRLASIVGEAVAGLVSIGLQYEVGKEWGRAAK